MYLKKLKLWNFRKFGLNSDDLNRVADLEVNFKKGLNLLVGENDSGKSTVIDAINYLVVPYSHEYLRLTLDDFHNTQSKLRIECEFTGFSINEAKNFAEFLNIIDGGGTFDSASGQTEDEWIKENVERLHLRLYLEAEIKDNSVSWYDIKSGADDEGAIFRGEIRDYLRSMYLKPLRNAKYELNARPKSRLSQVLSRHKNFQENNDEKHPLTAIVDAANDKIKGFFQGTTNVAEQRGKEISDEIHEHIKRLFHPLDNKEAKFDISDSKLEQVLQKLSLELEEKKSGLGALNMLFIALELLLLKRKGYSGLHLGLIEEAEAHLHTQAQMRVLKYLQELSEKDSQPIQLILTTHSTHIAAEVNLENLIVFNNSYAYSMSSQHTKLDKSDYGFLQRFLDATKANLFFADGVIIAEGDAENLLIPTLAEFIDKNLVKYGVSIVNVGHSGLFRYSRIFQRNDEPPMSTPVSCIKDNDTKYERSVANVMEFHVPETATIDSSIVAKGSEGAGEPVKCFVSPNWTLEFDIALDPNIRKEFYRAVLYAEKASNAQGHIHLNQEKIDAANAQMEADFTRWLDEWANDEDINAKIAYEIYKKCKKNKSMTAQHFSQILSEKLKNPELNSEFINAVKNSQKLKYIFDAINYATEPLIPQG